MISRALKLVLLEEEGEEIVLHSRTTETRSRAFRWLKACTFSSLGEIQME